MSILDELGVHLATQHSHTRWVSLRELLDAVGERAESISSEEVIDWICEPGIERSRIMTTPVDCPAPWCRELEAILRHGPVHIHPEYEGERIKSYLVVWMDHKSPDAHSYRGHGTTLKEAVDDVVEKYSQRN